MSANSKMDNLSPLKRALIALEEMKGKLNTLQKEKNEPIAVIGLGCRFPGARNVREFWHLLEQGMDAISEVPRERFDVDAYYDPNPGTPGKMITKWGGFIDDVDKFDPQLFGISPREAYKMDPQQRLLLEVAWEALEDAGIVLDQLARTRTGVFIGVSHNDYSHLQGNDYSKIDAYAGTGNAFSIAANRLSYTFDLEGPSVAVDTACSSSLVSTHLACQSLRNGESDMALAGGAGLILSPELTITFSQAQMMAPGGRCRTFDADAEGYVRGEGVGIIVLKRLSDAIRDRNHILAVIRGSAVNQDGKSNGLTAPNSLAQQKVIRQALKNSAVRPEDIDYIEAHGTGTILGDPIEVQALSTIMKDRPKEKTCYLGSVKTNIGHLEAAAGVAGLIKTILSVYHGRIPPHLHFKKLNPHISADEMPFKIPTELTPWPDNGHKRRAGTSAFGFGGTNAHVVLEEAPPQPWFDKASDDDFTEQSLLFVLSAHNEQTLRDRIQQYQHFIVHETDDRPRSFYDLNANLALKRTHLDHRLAMVAKSKDELLQKINLFLHEEEDFYIQSAVRDPNFQPKIAFVFSGQGPQWWAMGRELLEKEPIFLQKIEQISELLESWTHWSLLDELKRDEKQSRLDQTEVAQPALFALQVGLATVWRTWGIHPNALVGHSVGEVAAAHISGILSLEDAVKVIYHRSRLMQKATGLGKMAAVDLAYQDLLRLTEEFSEHINIGAHNSHISHVISGKEESIDAVLARLEKKDIFFKKLSVNYAFHSPQMEPFRQELQSVLNGLQVHPANIPLISTVTGRPALEEDYNAEYWGRNIREAVQFSEAIDHLIEKNYTVFIEIGPHPVLKNYIKQNLSAAHKKGFILPSLRRKEPERAMMLNTVGRLYVRGLKISFATIYDKPARPVPLPSYPFQKERYWIESKESFTPKQSVGQHPLLGSEQTSVLLPNNSNWTVELKSDYVAYLNSSVDRREIALPESAYLEMAIAASKQSLHAQHPVLRNIIFKNVLNMQVNDTRELHFTLSPVSGKRAYFQAYSRKRFSSGKVQWILHSLGSISNEDEPDMRQPQVDLKSIQTRLGKKNSRQHIASSLGLPGLLNGGPVSIGKHIWFNKDEILVKFKIDQHKVGDWSSYNIHPIILSNTLRLIATSAQISEQKLLYYKAHSLDKLNLYQNPGHEFWVHIKLNHLPASNRALIGNIQLINSDGQVALEAEGLRLNPISIAKVVSDLFYTVEWQRYDQPILSGSLPAGRWIIFSDSNTISETLASKLKQKNREVLLLSPGIDNKLVNEELGSVNWQKTESLKSLLTERIQNESALVFMEGSNNADAFRQFIHILLENNISPNLVQVVTRSALNLSTDETIINPDSAILWDEALRAMRLHPRLNIKLLDIDGKATAIFDYLLKTETFENQAALRNQSLYVPRMVHKIPSNDGLSYIPAAFLPSSDRKNPEDHEIEIEVRAVGINDQDIKFLEESSAQPIGLECAGIVTKTGRDVSGFKKGDRVFTLGQQCFSRYHTVQDSLSRHIPEGFSFTQAAAIPFNYVTAHYALTYLAHIQPGEHILILDADSPVGMACAIIARYYGANIYATLLNTSHKSLLEQLDIHHILTDKDYSFIDRLNELTEGKGVDIIVNTSRNDHLPSGFSALKEFGRFVELNTQDTFEQPIVYHHLRRNISFFAVDLFHMIKDQTGLVHRLFSEVTDKIASREYELFPIHESSISQLPAIFRQFKHHITSGKLVTLLDEVAPKKENVHGYFDSRATYFIAGTDHNNDRALIQWLFDNGVRNILFANLSTSPLKSGFLNALVQKGLKVKFVQTKQLTVSDQISGCLISLGSIDRTQDVHQVRQKLDFIYEYFKERELEFFITLSVFSIIGNEVTDQNIINIDHLIRGFNLQRQKQGLSALHVQIGGNVPQDISKATMRWQILNHILPIQEGHLIITEADWEALYRNYKEDEIPGFYRALISSFGTNGSQSIRPGATEIQREDLLSADEHERAHLLENYLINEISRVVKIPTSKIRPDQPLTSLGIDSLMAIELKNTIESQIGVQLPIATLLKGPSVLDVKDELLTQLNRGIFSAGEKPLISRHETDWQEREYKLSYGQQAMFFQHLMNPDSIFNLAYAVRIRSEFDVELLHQSFQTLVDRHPSLRTTFHWVDGKPVQRIHPEMSVFFIEEEARSWDEEQLRNRLDDEVLSHFDLESGPLMRVFLFRRAQKDTVLLFVMHHIVTDIWSQAVLLDELSRIFEDGGITERLDPVEYDYLDFIRWQDELLQSKAGEELFGYWKKKLHGELPLLNIPTDRPRPAVQTFKGRTETLWFPPDISRRIHQFSEQHGVTVFTLLLTAYYILLNRYTSQDDIIVGSPTAGRSKNEFARTIGYFVNPVLFRASLHGQPSFKHFLQQVKHTVLEAFDHMDYPLSLLVEKLQPERDPSRTPLFQTMFILQRAHLMHDQGLSEFALSREGATLNLGGLTVESMNLEQGVAPFDLTMMAIESGSGLAASLGYNVDLFDADTIRRMLQHYITLLQSILENPEQNIDTLPLLTEEEITLVTENWNRGGEYEGPTSCLHEDFTAYALRNPEKTALIFEEHSLSYGELNQRANRLAHYLIQSGVRPETVVGICLDRSPEMVISILAVHKAGGAYLPLDPTYPAERIRYMISDARTSFIITTRALFNKVDKPGIQHILIDENAEDRRTLPETEPAVNTEMTHLAYLIYTSGSTGKPKGTMLQHRGLANAIHSTQLNYYVNENSRVLQFASFSFDASVEEIFSTLSCGATLILAKKETLLSLAELISLISSRQITNITLPPSVLNVLQPQDFPTLKSVVSAGERCPLEIARKWSTGKHFVNGYGPTEATICTTSFEINRHFSGITVPIGKPIRNVQTYVLDTHLNPVPIGVPGELYIGGDGLARGYINRPELTAERFIPDPFGKNPGQRLYRTGDLVRFLADGNLEFLDRVDHQVKVRGFRIELGEIESILLECREIKEAAVIAKTDHTGTRLIAYVVPEAGANMDASALKACILTHLPEYMVPSAFVEMKSLPTTANGKLDRSHLPDPEQQSGGPKFIRPGSEIERKLAKIWQEILGQEKIGINDSFFELGGHSLGIVQLQGKIKEAFNKDLNVVDMFKYPTIRAMAKFIGDEDTTKETIQKSQTRAARQREATRTQQNRIRSRRKK